MFGNVMAKQKIIVQLLVQDISTGLFPVYVMVVGGPPKNARARAGDVGLQCFGKCRLLLLPGRKNALMYSPERPQTGRDTSDDTCTRQCFKTLQGIRSKMSESFSFLSLSSCNVLGSLLRSDCSMPSSSINVRCRSQTSA